MKPNLEKYLHLNAHVYVKDERGYYVACNDHMAEDLGLRNRQDIAGLADQDTIVADYCAVAFQMQDRLILEQRVCKTFYNDAIYNGERQFYSTIKKPFSYKGSFNNVLGISSIINEQIYDSVLSFNNSNASARSKRIKQHCHRPNFSSLSRREAECYFYLLRGYSASEVAVLQNISKRTVEDYIQRLKNKLGCFTKKELINTAYDYGFIAAFSPL